MRAVSPRSVLLGVAARLGLDITIAIPAHTQAAFLEYINSQLRNVWERYPFPEWTRVERRTYRASWAIGTTYAAGSEVWYEPTGAYYRALVPCTGVVPTTLGVWEMPTDLLQNISLEQAGETLIGEILGVYRVDPRVYRGALQYEFSLIEDGILVPGQLAQPWIEFTMRAPVVTAEALDGQTFPYVIAEVVKLLAAADAYREDGQFEKGAALESQGMSRLDEELDKIELLQGQQRRWGI